MIGVIQNPKHESILLAFEIVACTTTAIIKFRKIKQFHNSISREKKIKNLLENGLRNSSFVKTSRRNSPTKNCLESDQTTALKMFVSKKTERRWSP